MTWSGRQARVSRGFNHFVAVIVRPLRRIKADWEELRHTPTTPNMKQKKEFLFVLAMLCFCVASARDFPRAGGTELDIDRTFRYQ